MSSVILCAGVGVAILLESLASPSTPASGTHSSDDATLRAVALWASLLLLGATAYAALRTTGPALSLAGSGLIVLGGWLRAAAMRNLGSQFRTEAGADTLVTTGIHAAMRHPSELGLLCWVAGLFVAAPSLLAGALALAQLPLLVARLRIEEAALASRFTTQWKRYADETSRFGL